MIIWSGHGYVVAVVIFLSCLLTELAAKQVADNPRVFQESAWALPLALALAGGATYGLNRTAFADSHRSHSLFFVPMTWWPVILGVVAAAIFAGRLGHT